MYNNNRINVLAWLITFLVSLVLWLVIIHIVLSNKELYMNNTKQVVIDRVVYIYKLVKGNWILVKVTC